MIVATPAALRDFGPALIAELLARHAAGDWGDLGAFDPDAVYAELAGNNISVLTPVDAGYPGRLREIPDPPPALFVSGELPDVPAVALVGSRRASRTGIEAARELGRALGERGVCVVSGLALGVDAAAHEGTLDAGGQTVGVLGCGIDVT